MLDTIYLQLAVPLMVLVGIFAFVKGDPSERLGMGAYLLGWLATVLIQDDGKLYQNFKLGWFVLDVVMAGTFGYIVWTSKRSWAVWAAALQLLVVMSHVVYLFDVRPPMASFYTVVNMASYGILIAIGVGTFWAWQERRAAGLE